MEDLMTRETIALRFKVTPRTIQRWEKKGMPVIKLGEGLRRYELEKVLKWMENYETN